MHKTNRRQTIISERESTFSYYFYLALMLLLIALIIITPLFQALGGFFEFLAGISYFSFSLTCHQIASRSLFIFGEKMAVCSRCFGIYFGMLAGAIIFPLFARITSRKIPHIAWLVAAVVPMAVDGLTQFISYYGVAIPFVGLRESTNELRLITGLIAGFAVSFYIIPIFNIISQAFKRKR